MAAALLSAAIKEEDTNGELGDLRVLSASDDERHDAGGWPVLGVHGPGRPPGDEGRAVVRVAADGPLPTPTVAASTVAPVPPPGGALTEAGMVAALREAGWPESEIPYALRVFWCESSYRPAMVGRLGELGLAQLRPEYHLWRLDGGDWRDPVSNLRAALSLWIEAGWQPWSCAR